MIDAGKEIDEKAELNAYLEYVCAVEKGYEEEKRHYSSNEYKKINIEKEIAEYVEKKREIIKTNPSLHYAYSSKRNKKKIQISEME